MRERIIIVEMPDGSRWGVPARLVAEDRSAYYAAKDTKNAPVDSEEYKSVFAAEYEYIMQDNDEMRDWARNNMNWSDVSAHARKLGDAECDYDEGWANGKMIVMDAEWPSIETETSAKGG